MKEGITTASAETEGGLVERAQRLFESDDLATFFSIKDVLRELATTHYGNELLPDAVLDEVVGGKEYIGKEEETLRSINGSSGIYHPYGSEGGGDFWQKSAGEGGVGGSEVRMADIVGHGEGSVARKALVFKALRLLKARPTNETADTFQKLDGFLEGMPFPAATEYMEAKIVPAETGRLTLEVESASGIRIFIRQKKTGAGSVVASGLDDGYPTLGHGFIKDAERKVKVIEDIDLSDVDIYIASDGLYEMRDQGKDGPQFQERLSAFLAESQGLDPEAFYGKLAALVADAESKNLVGDDLTLLRLQVVGGRMQ